MGLNPVAVTFAGIVQKIFVFFRNTHSAKDPLMAAPILTLVRRCSIKRCSQKIHKIQRETACARVSFLVTLQAKASNFIKKRLQHRWFFCEISEILRTTPFFTEYLWWLLRINEKRSKIHKQRVLFQIIYLHTPCWLLKGTIMQII